MKPKQQKSVYFLRQVGGIGPIKIGSSVRPEGRRHHFCMWSPVPLEVVASGPGSGKLESFLHRKFKADRLHLEWFSPSPELLAGIAEVARGVPVDIAFGAVRVSKPATYDPDGHIYVAAPVRRAAA